MTGFETFVIILTVVFGGFGLFVIWISLTGKPAKNSDDHEVPAKAASE